MAESELIVTGLIAREVNTGEADRYLTILTSEQGKVECFAKGIRNQKSKLQSTAHLITYGEYKLFHSKNRYILTSGKAIETFYNIRTDVEKYAYAVHFLEVARDVTMEGQPFPEALQTLLNTLHVLTYRDFNNLLTARVYETRMLALSGFAPALEHCAVCGRPLDSSKGTHRFTIAGSGLLCDDDGCLGSDRDAVLISSGTIRALQFFASCPPKSLFQFQLSDKILGELSRVVPPYLRHHMEKPYTKLHEVERYRLFEQEMHYTKR